MTQNHQGGRETVPRGSTPRDRVPNETFACSNSSAGYLVDLSDCLGLERFGDSDAERKHDEMLSLDDFEGQYADPKN